MTDVLIPPPPVERGDRVHPDLDRRRVLVVLLVAGLATDAVVRSGFPTVAGVAALVVVTIGLLVTSPGTNRTAWLLGGGAVAVAAWLPLRTSPWLVPLDVLVGAGLVAVAATYVRGGRLRDLTFVGGVRRLLAAPARLVQGPPVLGRMLTAGWRRRPDVPAGRGPEVARGLVLAVPIVGALALLLASADTVFASFFQLPLSPTSSAGHLALIAAGAVLVLPLLLEAVGPVRTEAPPTSRLGRIETTVLLSGIVLLYACFTAAQVVAALGGADHVLETAGLSYAEYARRGFFQLLAVAGLTLLLLLAVRGTVRPVDRPARRGLLALAEATVVLTLVIVGVAVRRLALYDDVFGLTMLRLSSTVAAWWIGGVFVLVGLAFAGVRRSHDWLAGAIATLAVLTLVGYNAVDPEAVVVRHNLARDATEVPVDISYLQHLSDDAVPALAAALPDLDRQTAAATVEAICRSGDATEPGLLDWNRSTSRAAETRARLAC
jgi:hypothetical protein